MTYSEILNFLFNSSFCNILFFTLIGATLRLFCNKSDNGKKHKSLKRYLLALFVDWGLAVAAGMITHAYLFQKIEAIDGLSIFYGFLGHKKIKKLIDDYLKTKLK